MKTETMITVFTDTESEGWLIKQIDQQIHDTFFMVPDGDRVEYRVTVTVERVE